MRPRTATPAKPDRVPAISCLLALALFPAAAAGNPNLLATTIGASLPEGYKAWGLATEIRVPVYNTLEQRRRVIGRIRRGSRVPVRLALTDQPCKYEDVEGQWLETPGGFLCTSTGIVVGASPRELWPRQRSVDPDQPMPFDFVKVTRVGVSRYSQPILDPELEVEPQTKAFFLAKDAVFTRGGKRWLRTVYGEHMLLKDTRPVIPSTLKGVELSAHQTLPIAFVIGPEAGVTVRCLRRKRTIRCGQAPKHSRFKPVDRVVDGLREYVRSDKGKLYPAEYVRTADVIDRPDDVPQGARWVHINLDEQIFVAYEGDIPQYTSLISSGVPGRDTPDGLYQTQRKYLTKTMRGPDETHERYRVEEIPWVMYYHGAYAVHGAYWHNQFGEVRSHGCTNVAPVDALWLFKWDQTEIPSGWHANVKAEGGLFFYFSRFEEAENES